MTEKSEETKTLNMIEDARVTAERLAKENDRAEEIVKRMEVLESRKILGGQTTAGSTAPERKEETPKEYAARIMRGNL